MRERLKELRKSLGMTQQDFADRLGIKRNTVATYETRSNLSNGAISLICKTFNVNESWLRTGEGEMFESANKILVNDLMQSYDLPESMRNLMENFLELSHAQQELVIEYAQKAVKTLKTVETEFNSELNETKPSTQTEPPEVAQPPPQDADVDPDIESQVEEYRQALYSEKRSCGKIQSYEKRRLKKGLPVWRNPS